MSIESAPAAWPAELDPSHVVVQVKTATNGLNCRRASAAEIRQKSWAIKVTTVLLSTVVGRLAGPPKSGSGRDRAAEKVYQPKTRLR
jgi:hypothetical protein